MGILLWLRHHDSFKTHYLCETAQRSNLPECDPTSTNGISILMLNEHTGFESVPFLPVFLDLMNSIPPEILPLFSQQNSMPDLQNAMGLPTNQSPKSTISKMPIGIISLLYFLFMYGAINCLR